MVDRLIRQASSEELDGVNWVNRSRIGNRKGDREMDQTYEQLKAMISSGLGVAVFDFGNGDYNKAQSLIQGMKARALRDGGFQLQTAVVDNRDQTGSGGFSLFIRRFDPAGKD